MIRGVIAGNFDVIHPGYIKTFEVCKNNCDHFTILLQTDPSIERPNKLKPILSIQERIEILSSIIYINEIKVYTYEAELVELLKNGNYNKRFLGDDYKNKSFTGDEIDIQIQFISRDHGWSTTKFKNLIAQSVNFKKD